MSRTSVLVRSDHPWNRENLIERNVVRVAVEVQGSSLPVSEIARRTRAYYELGVCVLWVQPHTPTEPFEKAAPRAWEKWIHTLYFGRVHYWTEDGELLPVHFGDYQIWVEPTEWYEEDATHREEGGYYRYSKRWRTALWNWRRSFT